jgi:hypothetical protein
MSVLALSHRVGHPKPEELVVVGLDGGLLEADAPPSIAS